MKRTFHDWLASLRERNLRLLIVDGHAAVDGDQVHWLDHEWASRYDGAITAVVKNPELWRAVVAGDVEEVAKVDDWECKVRGCDWGGMQDDADNADENGLRFCDEHLPAWWHARIPGDPAPPEPECHPAAVEVDLAALASIAAYEMGGGS